MTSDVNWLIPHSYDHLVSTSGQCDASKISDWFIFFYLFFSLLKLATEKIYICNKVLCWSTQ